MDQTGAAIIQEMSQYGLVPLILTIAALCAVLIVCIFVIPVWRRKIEADTQIEKARQEHEAKIESLREQRLSESQEREARLDEERLELNARTAVLIEGMKTSLENLNSTTAAMLATAKESDVRSNKLSDKVDSVATTITRVDNNVSTIKRIVLKEGRYYDE